MRCFLSVVFALLSFAVFAAYSKIKVDVSSLPEDKRFISRIVETRVNERTIPSDVADTFIVRFQYDNTLNGETSRIRILHGCAEISASRFRSLLFGAGKFLRKIQYGSKTFDVNAGEFLIVQSKEFRQIYFARHFNTWYHRASVDELMRYIDDLALTGINAIQTFPAVAAVDLAYSDKSEQQSFKAVTKAIADHLKEMDMAFTVSGGNNVSGKKIPTELKAMPYAPHIMRGFSHFSVCPSIDGGYELLIDERKRALLATDGLSVDNFIYWPYDEGGCACDKCSPWGGRGYLKMIEKLSVINRGKHPASKHIVSTWLFDEEDWKGLYKYIESNKRVDYLLVDSHDQFPEFPLRNPVPKNVPIITFPEVSMWGRFPWGGTGATPLPRRFEKLFRDVERVVSGFSIYSEGLFDDITKFVITSLYSNPEISYKDALIEYCNYEFPGANPEEFITLIELLEDIHQTSLDPKAHAGNTSNNSFANYVKYGNPIELERRSKIAKRAKGLAKSIESSMLLVRRKNWRWRQIALRAEIDASVYETRDIRNDKAIVAYNELIEIYHAQRQYQLLCEGCPFAGYTCPPLVDHFETTKGERK